MIRYKERKESWTYSPELTEFVPKFVPTTPVHVHDLLALFVHVAVAVAPTLRQVTDAKVLEPSETMRRRDGRCIFFKRLDL